MKHMLSLTVLIIVAAQTADAQDLPTLGQDFDADDYPPPDAIISTFREVELAKGAARAAGSYIALVGGFYDGAASGQTASVLVTADDHVICHFHQLDFFDEIEPTTDYYQFSHPGLYDNLTAGLLVNVVTETENRGLFQIEWGGGGDISVFSIDFGDVRMDALQETIRDFRNPCWMFG